MTYVMSLQHYWTVRQALKSDADQEGRVIHHRDVIAHVNATYGLRGKITQIKTV